MDRTKLSIEQDNEFKKTQFGKLSIRDYFLYHGNVYIKMEPLSGDTSINAVDLTDGLASAFDDTDEVLYVSELKINYTTGLKGDDD